MKYKLLINVIHITFVYISSNRKNAGADTVRYTNSYASTKRTKTNSNVCSVHLFPFDAHNFRAGPILESNNIFNILVLLPVAWCRQKLRTRRSRVDYHCSLASFRLGSFHETSNRTAYLSVLDGM